LAVCAVPLRLGFFGYDSFSMRNRCTNRRDNGSSADVVPPTATIVRRQSAIIGSECGA
jgi:hypothetical protein